MIALGEVRLTDGRCASGSNRESHLSVVKMHFELLEVEPAFGLVGIEIVKEVSREEAERVEFEIGSEENRRGRLLIDYTYRSTNEEMRVDHGRRRRQTRTGIVAIDFTHH